MNFNPGSKLKPPASPSIETISFDQCSARMNYMKFIFNYKGWAESVESESLESLRFPLFAQGA